MSTSPEQTRVPTADEWRARSLAELHELLLATVSVDEVLDTVVARAADRAGEGVAATLTLHRGPSSTVAAATDESAAACDRAEHRADAGPCLSAVRENRVVTVTDVGTDDRWPAWREAALAGGYGATIALPARVGPDLGLALNLYRPSAGDWADEVLGDVTRYADDAARALAVAARVEDQLRVNADLQRAMSSRSVIDQAIGVVMAQNRCDAQRAFDILRSASQHRNQKLRDLAGDIVARVSGAEATTPNEFRPRTPGH